MADRRMIASAAPHWSERFLGVAYEQGAQGPDTYDCWSHFRWVQRERFGRDVAFVPSPKSRGTTARILPVLAAEFGWTPVETPASGDGVLLSYWTMPSHVGVYVDDAREPSVLHCPQGGAALHSLFHLKAAGWRLRGYYRYREPA